MGAGIGHDDGKMEQEECVSEVSGALWEPGLKASGAQSLFSKSSGWAVTPLLSLAKLIHFSSVTVPSCAFCLWLTCFLKDFVY